MGVKDWLVVQIAKVAGRNLKLEEGPMTDSKAWYKSKGVINGILIVAFGVYDLLRANLAPQVGWNLPEIPPIVFTILGALGIYARATATKVIGK